MKIKQIIGSIKFEESCNIFCQLQLKQKIYDFIKPTCKNKQVLSVLFL